MLLISLSPITICLSLLASDPYTLALSHNPTPPQSSKALYFQTREEWQQGVDMVANQIREQQESCKLLLK